MKLYGSLQNRMEENRQFVEEIKVGTGMMYKIVFDFLGVDGAWHHDFLNDNGQGFVFADAIWIASDLKRRDNIRNVNMEEL